MPSWKKVIVSGSNAILGTLVVSGAAAIGTSSLGPNENTLTLGARDSVSEGGQIGFNAPGGSYISASYIDLYQNRLRILKGTNAGSIGEAASWNMHTLQMSLPAYTSTSAFPGTAVATLAVDSGGNILTIAGGGGGTVTSVATSGTVNGITLTGGTITTSGTITLGGSISGLTTSNLSSTAGITNGQLANSSITIGSTAISLGSSATTIAGLTSVTSTAFTGSLQGTASVATKHYTANAGSGTYYPIISTALGTGNLDYFNNSAFSLNLTTNTLNTTASYAITASVAISSSISDRTTRQDLVALNQTGGSLAKGLVVRIEPVSNASDTPRIVTASYESDAVSAATLGITSEAIANGSTGFVITEGILTGINTSGWSTGTLLFLGANGVITTTPPTAPSHSVRLGQVVREQSVNGSIYVRVDNGAELGELHDVKDSNYGTTTNYGDLLVRSGSVWTNTKQLTGSYGLTGSLTVNGPIYFASDAAGSNGLSIVRNGSNNWTWGTSGIGNVMVIAGNTITLPQVVTTSNGLNVTPGGNQTTLGLGVTVGSYPAANLAKFSSGSVTVMNISGSGIYGTGSFTWEGPLSASWFTGSISGSTVQTGIITAAGNVAFSGAVKMGGIPNAYKPHFLVYDTSTAVVSYTSASNIIVASASYAANGGVTQIVAGTNVTISPAGGTGVVTINATGGGGGGAGTVNSGISGSFAYYPTTGTTVDDQPNVTWNGINSSMNVVGAIGSSKDSAFNSVIVGTGNNSANSNSNTAIGYRSLLMPSMETVTLGSYIFDGSGANTEPPPTGSVVIGHLSAQKDHTLFEYNIAIGPRVLSSGSYAQNTIAIGPYALNSPDGGTQFAGTIAIGPRAGQDILNSTDTILIGDSAGVGVAGITTVSRDIFIGSSAGTSIQNSTGNVGIGFGNLSSAQTANHNLALGYRALDTSVNPLDVTAVGPLSAGGGMDYTQLTTAIGANSGIDIAGNPKDGCLSITALGTSATTTANSNRVASAIYVSPTIHIHGNATDTMIDHIPAGVVGLFIDYYVRNVSTGTDMRSGTLTIVFDDAMTRRSFTETTSGDIGSTSAITFLVDVNNISPNEAFVQTQNTSSDDWECRLHVRNLSTY